MKWQLPNNIKEHIKKIAPQVVPDNFDYKTYLSIYPDLTEAGITTEEEAIEHYILFGKKEERIYIINKPAENYIIPNLYNQKIYTKQTINKFFDQIYVIALNNANNNQFLKNYLTKFKIKYSIIEAINGNTNSDILNYYQDYLSWSSNDPRRHRLDNKIGSRLLLGPGAIGLLLTYKQIYIDAINKKYKYILILEEDVLLDKNFNKHINNFLKFKKNFDLLFMGCSHHAWNNPKILTIPNTDTTYYKAPTNIDGAFSIAYNCKILPKLLSELSIINSPIDSGPIRQILQNNNSYILYPNIAIADTTPVSSISNISRNLRSHSLKMRWNLKNIDFTRSILKTSILIPNYNSERTIERCIKSIQSQTYQNLEVILVDDNSSDNSVKIIKKLAHKDKKIKLIELKDNVGAYVCRNIALKNSSGYFISLLDCDDILLSNKLEVDIYNYFNHYEYEIFFSNIYRSKNINLNQLLTDQDILKAIRKERKPHLICDENQCIYGHNTNWDYKFRFGLPTIFVERDFFNKYGLWNEKYRYGMDLELIQRYIAKKYNIFIEHDKLWTQIYSYKAQEYGIFLSPSTHYISFPMNQNNATNKCKDKERKKIHKECDKAIKKMIEGPIAKKNSTLAT